MTKLAQPDPHHGGRPRNPDAFRLLEELGTNPKVYYLSTRKWVREMGDQYFGKKKDMHAAAKH